MPNQCLIYYYERYEKGVRGERLEGFKRFEEFEGEVDVKNHEITKSRNNMRDGCAHHLIFFREANFFLESAATCLSCGNTPARHGSKHRRCHPQRISRHVA